jgi:hypothetical protein
MAEWVWWADAGAVPNHDGAWRSETAFSALTVKSAMALERMRKEETMESYKLPLVMAFTELQRNDNQPGQYRQLTPDELDARVDVGWGLPDLKDVLVARVEAVLSHLRPRGSRHLDPTPQPSVTQTALSNGMLRTTD